MRIIKGLLLSTILVAFVTVSARAQGNFVYTNNDIPLGPNSVSAFAVAANGTLTEVPGSPFSTGGIGLGGGTSNKNRIIISPVGNLLFAINRVTSDISVFRINTITGSLTAVPGSPFAIGMEDLFAGFSLSVTPDGRFLMVSTGTEASIIVFSIGAAGTLTPVAGSPFPTGGHVGGMKVSPNGRFLAVAVTTSIDAVAVFNIEANGALTPVAGSPFSAPGVGFPANIEMNSAGNLLFAPSAEFHPFGIDIFNVNAGGGLTPINAPPFVFNPSANPIGTILLSRDERFLFMTNFDGSEGSITVLNVATDGSLTEVAGSPFGNPGGGDPNGMAINSNGTLLYVANFTADSISVFQIGANGTLTPVPGSPFPIGFITGLTSLAAFPTGTASADICIQDESNGNILQINSATGDYQLFNCSGFIISGKGILTKKGSTLTLQHNATDRRVSAKIDGSSKRATASIQLFSQGSFTISDRNTANNTCACN
jgi:6-phosphogluconolactonase (cycloisomerase 2 family)